MILRNRIYKKMKKMKLQIKKCPQFCQSGHNVAVPERYRTNSTTENTPSSYTRPNVWIHSEVYKNVTIDDLLILLQCINALDNSIQIDQAVLPYCCTNSSDFNHSSLICHATLCSTLLNSN
jgi:hypothetical protein